MQQETKVEKEELQSVIQAIYQTPKRQSTKFMYTTDLHRACLQTCEIVTRLFSATVGSSDKSWIFERGKLVTRNCQVELVETAHFL